MTRRYRGQHERGQQHPAGGYQETGMGMREMNRVNKTYICFKRTIYHYLCLSNVTKEIFNVFKFMHIVMSVCQVQDVVGVMRNNIDKVLERDSKLNDLDHR